MADRYPNRPFPADDYGRGDQLGSGGGESDPLAELARLIGQTDPFGGTGRANPAPPPPRAAVRRESVRPTYQPQHQAPIEDDEPSAPSGPPQWIQRANIQRQAEQAGPREVQRDIRRELPPELPREVHHEIPYEEPAEEYPSAVHPLHRYAAPQPAYQQPAAYQQPPAPPQAPAYQQDYREPSYDEAAVEEQPDPSRYDDALYGQLESGAQDFQRDPAYPDDPYAYQDGDEEEPEERPRRRGGLLTVVAVVALAVVGTGAAFAYRTYVGSARTGEPPIIKADNTPTKVMPAPSDSSGKNPDRMPTGDGTEKIVPREEAPVDVNARTAGPRVVFPPLNQNASPPSPSSVSTNTMPPAANAAPGVTSSSNGTMPNGEPRKIRTFSVHGDQPDTAAAPVTAAPATPPAAPKPTVATRQVPPPAAAQRNQPSAPTGNGPMSLSPDSAQASLPPAPAEPRTRMVATTPTAAAPASDAAPAGEGRFLVQLSSQPSEAEAQSSFRSLQKKFPDQLGSQSPVIKRADLGDKGIRYRAMVGPFASRDEAARFCMSYKSAGGQCFVP
jgi:SPOR domain